MDRIIQILAESMSGLERTQLLLVRDGSKISEKDVQMLEGLRLIERLHDKRNIRLTRLGQQVAVRLTEESQANDVKLP